MDYSNKTKDELIYELLELNKLYESLKNRTDFEVSQEVNSQINKFDLSYLEEQVLVKALMNNLEDYVYFKDLNSRFIRINHAHAKSLGLSDPSEAIGKTDFDFYSEEFARVAFSDEMTIIQTGKPIKKEERLISENRPVSWVSALKLPLLDLNGKIIGTFGISRDITERKKSEEQIFLLANALKSSNDCVSITDVNDRILFLNDAFYRTYGYSIEDIKDDIISLIRSDKNLPEILAEILPATLKGGWHGELINKRKDGTEFPVYLSTSIVKNSKGDPIALIGVANDITEIKKTELALRQSEERFRSVTQSANDAIISADHNGKILGWNNGAEKSFGYTESEIIGKPLGLIIPTDYLDLHIAGLSRLSKGGDKHVIGKTVELTGSKKTGEIFPVELSLSEWETSEGQFYTGIIRDITKRRRNELENKAIGEIAQGITSTSNLDELLKLIHKAIGKVVYAENCFIALFDQDTGLFNFAYYVDSVDPMPEPTAMYKSCTAYVFRTLKPFLFNEQTYNELQRKNEVELIGSPSPSWIGIPLQLPSRAIGVLVLQHYGKENVFSESDVNFLISTGSQIAIAIERKITEEELLAKNKQLQYLNEEKDKFFSIIAHDLRGPLSAFVGASQIITEEIRNMSLDEIKEIAVSMKISATNIYTLLENLLEWSRLRRGGLDFIPELLPLGKKIHEYLEVLSESAQQKNIDINIEVPDNIVIYADNHMIDAVVRNMVSNSIKFSNPGSKVTVSAFYADNNMVDISISDTGIGMSEELKKKIFSMNEKTSRPGTSGEPSTGLGLLLCKEYIDKHHGKISVESVPGKGSKFLISIPVVKH